MQNTLTFFIFISFLFLFSCSSSKKMASSDSGYAVYSGGYGEDRALSKQKASKFQEATEEDRKVVYNASLSLEVKETGTQQERVMATAKKYGGYVLRTSESNYTIRVVSDSLKSALNSLSTLGKISNKTISGQDVTEEFADLEIRLDNAEKTRQRYLELLKKAQNVAEVLAVEKELDRLNLRIEQLKGRLNRLQEVTTYATIYLYLEEKVKPGPLGYIFVGFYKGIKFLFIRD